jgi:hypothetical protein
MRRNVTSNAGILVLVPSASDLRVLLIDDMVDIAFHFELVLNLPIVLERVRGPLSRELIYLMRNHKTRETSSNGNDTHLPFGVKRGFLYGDPVGGLRDHTLTLIPEP